MVRGGTRYLDRLLRRKHVQVTLDQDRTDTKSSQTAGGLLVRLQKRNVESAEDAENAVDTENVKNVKNTKNAWHATAACSARAAGGIRSRLDYEAMRDGGRRLRITVLMGDDSPEREISLASGQAVTAALRERGHQVDAVTIEHVGDVLANTQLSATDIVFPALHGGFGEDGHLQAVFEVMQLPYALSGPLACALAMNKAAAKRLMRGAGIPTPDWLMVAWDLASGRPRGISGADSGANIGPENTLTIEYIQKRATEEIGWPMVIKPNAAGSSVNVAILQNPAEFADAFEQVASRHQDVLLEKYIPGREVTGTIFLGRRLPLLEIRPRQGFYDYANKYTPGASEYLVPAPVHSPVYEQISDDALRVFDLLGCTGVARVDFRLDGNRYYCLEVNTIPGMTAMSLVPMAAASVGIDFATMLEDLCLDALARQRTVDPTRIGNQEQGS